MITIGIFWVDFAVAPGAHVLLQTKTQIIIFLLKTENRDIPSALGDWRMFARSRCTRC